MKYNLTPFSGRRKSSLGQDDWNTTWGLCSCFDLLKITFESVIQLLAFLNEMSLHNLTFNID